MNKFHIQIVSTMRKGNETDTNTEVIGLDKAFHLLVSRGHTFDGISSNDLSGVCRLLSSEYKGEDFEFHVTATPVIRDYWLTEEGEAEVRVVLLKNHVKGTGLTQQEIHSYMVAVVDTLRTTMNPILTIEAKQSITGKVFTHHMTVDRFTIQWVPTKGE